MSKLKDFKTLVKEPSRDANTKPGFDWIIWAVLLAAMVFIMVLAIKKL